MRCCVYAQFEGFFVDDLADRVPEGGFESLDRELATFCLGRERLGKGKRGRSSTSSRAASSGEDIDAFGEWWRMEWSWELV